MTSFAPWSVTWLLKCLTRSRRRHILLTSMGEFIRQCPIGGEMAHVATEALSYCDVCDYVFQTDLRVTQTYDREYVASRYDLYPTTTPLAYLRAGLALAFMQDCHHATVLDVGYGNGAFLKAIGQNGLVTYG